MPLLVTQERDSNCGHEQRSEDRYPARVDVKETRKINLIRLIERTYGTRRGAQREFAEAAGLAPGHVSQMVNGTRNIGDSVARRVERAIGLDHGYMDHPHQDTSPPGGTQAFDPDGPLFSRSRSERLGQPPGDRPTLYEQIHEAVEGVPTHVREEILATVIRIAERHHATLLERLRAVREQHPKLDGDDDP